MRHRSGVLRKDSRELRLYAFGTYSLGLSDPPPNKNFSISATRNARAFGSIGVSRFSLMSMVWCATHCAQASLEM